MSRQYTRVEVSKHNTEEDIWIVIDNNVYNVTRFINHHPGGAEILLEVAGLEATDMFDSMGHTLDALNKRESMKIGEVVEEDRITEYSVKPAQPFFNKKEHWIDGYVAPALVLGFLAFLTLGSIL